MSLPYIRPDLLQFTAYAPHPQGDDATQPPAAIDQLDTNECPYDLPSTLKQTLAWQYQQEIAANRYPDGSHGELKRAIATYVQDTSGLAGVTVAHISVGNGSDELIRSVLIATCLGGQGAILVSRPTFSMYAILAQTLGIPVISLERQPETFELDLEAADQAMAQAEVPVRVVFMVHPNSPTGNALTTAELDWLRHLPETVLVVVDEAYFEFSQQTTVADALERPNWVVLRTFSKALRLAAHRVGYALAPPPLIQTLDKVRLPYNLPSVSQAAARLALAHASELLAIVPQIQAERHRLIEGLRPYPQLRVWPSQANFIYARPSQPQRFNLDHLTRQLRQQGTHIRQTGGGLRITVGSPEENQRTLARLCPLLGASQGPAVPG